MNVQVPVTATTIIVTNGSNLATDQTFFSLMILSAIEESCRSYIKYPLGIHSSCVLNYCYFFRPELNEIGRENHAPCMMT